MLTMDRAGDVFTVGKVGRTQEVTPEGFLLCRDVPIARTGTLLYGPNEIPVEPGPDGIIRITRDDDQVFRPETIASALGKSVVDDHPDEDVNPDNWRDLSVGVALNVRRGEGVDIDYLVADLLITQADAIKLVMDGKREVSCGYDCDYEQIEPGRGRQHNIIFNHIALVESGRCGPRCAIGDSIMKTPVKKRSTLDRLMTAFKAKDEAAFEEALSEAKDEMTAGGGEGGGEQTLVIRVEAPQAESAAASNDENSVQSGLKHIAGANDEEAPAWFTAHVAENNARFEKLEAALAGIKGGTTDSDEDEDDGKTQDDADVDEGKTYDADEDEGEKGAGKTQDRARRTRDSAALETSFQDMIARAEILAPGIRIPTFDSKADPVRTRDRMCAFKRRVLVEAAEGDFAEQVGTVTTGRPVSKLTCDQVGIAFAGASELAKAANNVGSIGFVHEHKATAPRSIAEINAKNRAHWAKS